MFKTILAYISWHKQIENRVVCRIKRCELKRRTVRMLAIAISAFGLLITLPSHSLAETKNMPFDQHINVKLKTFLSAQQDATRIKIATDIANTLVKSADADTLPLYLASLAGAFVGISETNAPAFATAMIEAAGVENRDVVVAAIGVVIPSGSEQSEKVRSAIFALPGAQRATTQAILKDPARVLSQETRQRVMEARKILQFMDAHWDPVTSTPTRLPFADADGDAQTQPETPVSETD